MQSFGENVKKALYFGVGLVSLASEKASTTLSDVRQQYRKLVDEYQKVADEMVERGEITAEEARKLVEKMVNRVQQVELEVPKYQKPSQPPEPSEPRKIEIVCDDEEPISDNPENLDILQQKVSVLQEELRRIQGNE